jgi:Integrase core domain
MDSPLTSRALLPSSKRNSSRGRMGMLEAPARADHHQAPEDYSPLEAGYIFADCFSSNSIPLAFWRRTIHLSTLNRAWSPWESGYCESFNGKLRDEFLNGEIFYSLKEAQILTERWRVEYNTERPHSALGYRPPAPQAILPKQEGHGHMENASRSPHPHTPGRRLRTIVRTRRYTNIPLGTKDRSGHFSGSPWPTIHSVI